LETLEEKWNDIDRKAIHYEVKYQESQQTLSHVRESIKTIFKRMNCDQCDLPSGCGTGISESNMMQYLAVIESKVTKLIKIYDAVKEDDEFETAKPVRPVGASTNFQIKLPSTVEDYSDDEDDDDEDDRPSRETNSSTRP